MKRLSLLTTVSGLLLLSGCAGTESRFQCNETTHDSCMTMAQANKKAKLHEETPLIKKDAHRLPKLTERGVRAQLPEPRKRLAFSQKTRRLTPSSTEKKLTTSSTTPTTRLTLQAVKPIVLSASPLRKVDQIARLWIAPYIDNQDVYHHAGWVEFVASPSHWVTPELSQ